MNSQSPLLGFNNNVKHRGRLFHIQTEDSGFRHPHVITHLFADGGRILKTLKTSYAEHLGSETLPQIVRDLMKQQHKTMFIALRDGEFDHLLPDDVGQPVSVSPGAVGTSAIPVSCPPRSLPGSPGAMRTSTTPGGPAVADRSALPRGSRATARPPGSAVPPASPMNPLSVTPAGSAVEMRPAEAPSTITSPAPAPSFAAPDPSSGVIVSASRERSGTPGALIRREAPDPFAPPPPGLALDLSPLDRARPAEEAKSPAAAPAAGPRRDAASSGRYAASRPAAVFATASPDAGGSIFGGDDLVSEKSLDEVILSYLSDDLETSSSKK